MIIIEYDPLEEVDLVHLQVLKALCHLQGIPIPEIVETLHEPKH
jgi:hypothetical protein